MYVVWVDITWAHLGCPIYRRMEEWGARTTFECLLGSRVQDKGVQDYERVLP
jgi:hypothetical protein